MVTPNTHAYDKLLSSICYIYEHGTPAKSLGAVYGQTLASIVADDDLPEALRERFNVLCQFLQGLPDSSHPDRDLNDIRSHMLTLFGLLFTFPGYTPHSV